jgi:hypothetical protein
MMRLMILFSACDTADMRDAGAEQLEDIAGRLARARSSIESGHSLPRSKSQLRLRYGRFGVYGSSLLPGERTLARADGTSA